MTCALCALPAMLATPATPLTPEDQTRLQHLMMVTWSYKRPLGPCTSTGTSIFNNLCIWGPQLLSDFKSLASLLSEVQPHGHQKQLESGLASWVLSAMHLKVNPLTSLSLHFPISKYQNSR
jgi:hypothetical protein